MMKGNSKKIILLLWGVLLAVLLIGSANAQENVVTGKTYAMYFLTAINDNPDELSHMDVLFKEDGGVAAMGIDGHGLHFAVPGFFAATYFAIGVRMGFEKLDVFTAMTGITIDPFISGVGFFLIDYTQIEPYVFTGLETTEQ